MSIRRTRMGDLVAASTYRHSLLAAMNIFLAARLFSQLPRRRSHTRWRPRLISFAAILMAWEPAPSLTQRFTAVFDCLTAMFPSRRRPGRTYRGFTEALAAVSPWLEDAVRKHLRQATTGLGPRALTREGWRTFAVDGSKIDCPRSIANEVEFGTAGKSGCGPQMLLTTIWDMGSGLPWDWRIDRARGSEREHLGQMHHALPADALLVADAGFTGFDLLSALNRAGRSFLVRVGSNVTLLRRLGYVRQEGRDTVYLWRTGRRHRRRRPLVLRLIRAKHKGATVYLITNVLDPQRLPRAAAGRLYRLRWGVEVFYRSFKQTLQKRKMFSTSPRMARLELTWSLIGLLVLGLLNVRMLIARGIDPLQASVGNAIKVMRQAMRYALGRPMRLSKLLRLLGEAIKDGYLRRCSKSSYCWPHKKRQRPPGPPRTRTATRQEVALAQTFRDNPETE